MRRFDAAPARGFDAWLEPKRLDRWFFAGDEILTLELDARVGGRWRVLVRRGADEVDPFGEYLELARPGRLVFTLGVVDEPNELSIVKLDLATSRTGSELTLTHERVPAQYRERTQTGWTKILDRLDTRLGS